MGNVSEHSPSSINETLNYRAILAMPQSEFLTFRRIVGRDPVAIRDAMDTQPVNIEF
jgi:hypothetical protein